MVPVSLVLNPVFGSGTGSKTEELWGSVSDMGPWEESPSVPPLFPFNVRDLRPGDWCGPRRGDRSQSFTTKSLTRTRPQTPDGRTSGIPGYGGRRRRRRSSGSRPRSSRLLYGRCDSPRHESLRPTPLPSLRSVTWVDNGLGGVGGGPGWGVPGREVRCRSGSHPTRPDLSVDDDIRCLVRDSPDTKRLEDDGPM